MDVNKLLYQELKNLRDAIKEHGRRQSGRAPVVCSDNSLYEIARIRPQKLTDFEVVPGIGRTFIDNYGKYFLSVIQKYSDGNQGNTVQINQTAEQTLKELEKKLVNINKRNRLLFLPKTVNKYAVDLFCSIDKSLLEKIIFHGAEITISIAEGINDEEALCQRKKYIQLLREVNKDKRDKGQNDLYIAYPFVIGRLPGENFDVRAPLALFPVVEEVTPERIRLAPDKSRDTLYNNTLILAYYKFNAVSRPLPSDEIEDFSPQGFINNTLDFYAGHGLRIQSDYTGQGRFKSYKADEFPRFGSGELHLEECCILGKFPIRSSSIQKDFDLILEKHEINTLLNDLLLGANDIDYYDDSYSGEIEKITVDRPLEIHEADLAYINELNSSQENVLSAIGKLNEIVVQGPPGTGKSQTITSLISDQVSKGKSVLMVSEKKTALDVVYSRLGPLSSYAIMIDDVNNKDLFYRQMNRIVSDQIYIQDVFSEESEYISRDIDTQVKRLEEIANKMFTPDQFGIEPYKLYLECRRIDLGDESERSRATAIDGEISQQLMDLSHHELSRIRKMFSDENTDKKIMMVYQTDERYPWIQFVRGDLTDFDVLSFENMLQGFLKEKKEWSEKNFFARLFTKRELRKKAREIAQQFFSDSNDDDVDDIFDYSDIIINSLSDYWEYQANRPLYDHLGATERLFFETLMRIEKNCDSSLCSANDHLYNQILDRHIRQFESQNRPLMQDIDSFDRIIQSLSEAIAEKKKLTRTGLLQLLKSQAASMAESKRYGDMLRAIENKRKWSVNKFIRKFDYELFNNIKIWLMTPEVVSDILPLEKGLFDLVIFDEASQMYVEKGVPAILRAKKVVIAGDSKQLRPSSLGSGRLEMGDDELGEDEEVSAALEEESLLDLARFKYQAVPLNYHYRSKYEELIAFSNYAFYRGQLYVSPNTEAPQKPPIEVHKLENALWVNRENHEEARYIVSMLKRFFNERQDSETIGIITFNVNQRDLIEDLIDEECAKDKEFSAQIQSELGRKRDGEDIGLFVKNIESVQGDERDVIIFSIGYARNEMGRIIRNFGWLNQRGGENRLNVAISRARKKVHIVTSILPSELQVEDTKNDGPKILKKYLEYAFAISSGDKEAAKQVLLSFGDADKGSEALSFDSILEEQVYEVLREKGFEVDTQVGIGGYNIDLAIKKNGNYVLGIECDGKLYHSSKSARERDYHRQKYLESRGWRIHRIWSTNWWKHPEEIIRKIENIVNSIQNESA